MKPAALLDCFSHCAASLDCAARHGGPQFRLKHCLAQPAHRRPCAGCLRSVLRSTLTKPTFTASRGCGPTLGVHLRSRSVSEGFVRCNAMLGTSGSGPSSACFRPCPFRCDLRSSTLVSTTIRFTSGRLKTLPSDFPFLRGKEERYQLPQRRFDPERRLRRSSAGQDRLSLFPTKTTQVDDASILVSAGPR